MNEIAGGSPYGAATLAGADGSECQTLLTCLGFVNVDLKSRQVAHPRHSNLRLPFTTEITLPRSSLSMSGMRFSLSPTLVGS